MAPWSVWTRGRGRSVWSSRVGSTPARAARSSRTRAPRLRRRRACAAARPPTRCRGPPRTARAGRAAPPRSRRRGGPGRGRTSSSSSTPSDQKSVTAWCIDRRSTCSSTRAVEQTGPEQGSVLEVERPARLGPETLLEKPRGSSRSASSSSTRSHRRLGRDPLARLAAHHGEGGAQRRVARHQHLERSAIFERGRGEPPISHPHRRRHVVGRALRSRAWRNQSESWLRDRGWSPLALARSSAGAPAAGRRGPRSRRPRTEAGRRARPPSPPPTTVPSAPRRRSDGFDRVRHLHRPERVDPVVAGRPARGGRPTRAPTPAWRATSAAEPDFSPPPRPPPRSRSRPDSVRSGATPLFPLFFFFFFFFSAPVRPNQVLTPL